MVDRKRESIVENTKNKLSINYYIDTNAVKLTATFCSALLVGASSNKWTSKAVAHSNWRQRKAWQRRTHAFQFNFHISHFHILHSA